MNETDLCGAGFIVEVEFTASDNCGNGTTAIATYTLIDDVAPIMVGINDLDLVCPEFIGLSYEEQIDQWLTFNQLPILNDCSSIIL